MDYQQGQFNNMHNLQMQKMPFYMTYPMQNVLLEEAEYERDITRIKGLYPKEVREVLYYVEEECDKMEYEGSLMFDEYPDRLMMKKISNRIIEKYNVENLKASQHDTVEAEELKLVGHGRPGFPQPTHFKPEYYPPNGAYPNTGFENLVEILLFNEMYNRRCRHRRCRRWW